MAVFTLITWEVLAGSGIIAIAITVVAIVIEKRKKRKG